MVWGVAVVVSLTGLDDLVGALRDDGRSVIGPIVRDGVITHGEIESTADLPVGWSDEQEAGQYRLVSTDSAAMFGYATPSTSWKRYLYPERTLLVRSHRVDGAISVETPEPEAPPVAFFGIRSCDVAALGILDPVFLDPTATDPTYASRRPNVFVVAVACNTPASTCFCTSMDTGPSPTAGYDLAIRELDPDHDHRFLIEAATERGQALLDRVPSRQAAESDVLAATTAHDHAVVSISRRLDPVDPPLAAAHLDHPRWDDVAERCLACASCTMVCPTCFCSTTEDSTDLTGTEAERWRVWDSCFTLDFSHVHGGSIRSSTKSRYRQWLLHKLVTWHDQFGTSGCVGCGRCITWCPVGIDLTQEIAALAKNNNDEDRRSSSA